MDEMNKPPSTQLDTRRNVQLKKSLSIVIEFDVCCI